MENILEKITKSGLLFLDSLTLEQTLPLVVREGAKLVNAEFCTLYMMEHGKLRRVAVYPKNTPVKIEPRKKGYTYKAYTENKTYIINRDEIVKVHPELKGKNFGSAITFPLADHKKSIGAFMLLSHEDHRFSERDKHLLSVFGSYASLSIRKARLLADVQAAVRARDVFIAMAAHELRTPLTTINGYAHLIEKKMLGDESSQEARWVAKLTVELARLTKLINELLEAYRVHEGNLSYAFRENSIRSVVQALIVDFASSHPGRKIVVKDTLGTEDVFVGDFQKILQALHRVIDNAIKFSPQESEVALVLKENGRNFSIQVIDRGKGISSKDIPNAFSEFHKMTKNEEPGMGLGLFLAKNVVKTHKGKIAIKSKENKGTTVEISLPRARI